jgi:hypothetical protein
MPTKMSVTNKSELKSAQKHINRARDLAIRIRRKIEKRDQHDKKLDLLVRKLWKVSNMTYELENEIEVTIGGS